MIEIGQLSVNVLWRASESDKRTIAFFDVFWEDWELETRDPEILEAMLAALSEARSSGLPRKEILEEEILSLL